jgi:hypothetical protein
LTLLGRKLPVFDDKLASSRASTAAIRADLEGRACTDFETWEEARAALSREQAQCRRLGVEAPADLAMTDRVAKGVDDLLIASLDRARLWSPTEPAAPGVDQPHGRLFCGRAPDGIITSVKAADVCLRAECRLPSMA